MSLFKGILSFWAFLATFDPLQPALAYLDPGTGSMVLQLLLGGIGGIIVIVKMYWERILMFFHRTKDN